MSLADVIADLDGRSFTVTRPGAGDYDAAGVWIPAAPSTFAIIASVQPTRGREIERELGVEYGTDVRAVYTATELRATAGEADTISIDGEDYKLIRVESWTLDGETTYRAFATRKAKP